MASKAPPPSSATPAGVPPSGNAKYIIIAVLLVGIIGGAVAWKLLSKPDQPVTMVVDAGPPIPPPTKTRDDDIPLPPPIEDAGPEGGKKPVTNTGFAGTGCDSKACNGGRTSELETALAFRAKQAHRCYDQALGQDSTLKGHVTIAVRVGTNGSVCSAGVASNDMGSPAVANCVAQYFRGGAFPSPRGGCIDANVPITFVPRQ
jgi:hypothetical protein